MIEIINEKDVAKVTGPLSQIIKDAIGQVANVLVPAITEAAKNALGSVTITVGPITIEPIKITVGTDA